MKIDVFVVVFLALAYAMSWAVCVWLMYLICRCFSWKFSIIVATGIWLVICLIKGAFSNGSKK